MTKALTFNNGLFTDYISSGSDMSTIKRVTFKNGFLTNMVDTSASKTDNSSMTFKNGLLVGISPLVNPVPPVPNLIRIGAIREAEIWVESYWGGQNVTVHRTIGGERIDSGNLVGYLVGIKDRVYQYVDPFGRLGYWRAYTPMNNSPYWEKCYDLVVPDTHENRTYIFRPTVDSSWWDDASIKSQVYEKVPDIYEYTSYSEWCKFILEESPGGVFYNHDSIQCSIDVGAYSAGGYTYYKATTFWAPIYYDG